MGVPTAIDIHPAFQFMEFQGGPVPHAHESPKISTGGPTVAPTEQDIYRVTVPCGVTFYKDVLFPGKAVWCEPSMAVDCLTRVRFWPARRAVINWVARL